MHPAPLPDSLIRPARTWSAHLMDIVVKRRIVSLFSRFRTSERGAILVETLIMVPVVTIFSVGLLEFGVMFWERQQMQAGVRDAVRYWSRCSSTAATAGACSITKARNIAFYGTPDGGTALRVPNWYRPEDLTLTPLNPPPLPADTDLAQANGRLLYSGSPLFSLLDLNAVTIRYDYSMRFMGW